MFLKKLPQHAIFGVIHLDPLPGAPGYERDILSLKRKAREQAGIYADNGIDGIIIENFGDAPFFKNNVPLETVAAMSAIANDVKTKISLPLGINVLRNDGLAAIAIANAVEADFIRVNVLCHAVLADQGVIEGQAADILRKRYELGRDVKILADIRVKHAKSLVDMPLDDEVRDIEQRGKADGLILTGSHTGGQANPDMLDEVKQIARGPALIGSGINAENMHLYHKADGFIIGSAFKKDGKVNNTLDESRIKDIVKAREKL